MRLNGRPRLTEKAFLGMVVQLARLHGWLVMHQRPARTRGGWRTAVQGDPGFPDLVLLRDGVLIVAELKADDGLLTAAQKRWLEAFRAAGIGGGVWRPRDFALIELTLRRDGP